MWSDLSEYIWWSTLNEQQIKRRPGFWSVKFERIFMKIAIEKLYSGRTLKWNDQMIRTAKPNYGKYKSNRLHVYAKDGHRWCIWSKWHQATIIRQCIEPVFYGNICVPSFVIIAKYYRIIFLSFREHRKPFGVCDCHLNGNSWWKDGRWKVHRLYAFDMIWLCTAIERNLNISHINSWPHFEMCSWKHNFIFIACTFHPSK